MFVEEVLDEIVRLWGLSPILIRIVLAVVLFLAFGSFLSSVIGTRQVFIFGVVPVVAGAALGIFLPYFVIVALALGVCISFISFPKSISYKDRVRMVEVEMQLEALKEVNNG